MSPSKHAWARRFSLGSLPSPAGCCVAGGIAVEIAVVVGCVATDVVGGVATVVAVVGAAVIGGAVSGVVDVAGAGGTSANGAVHTPLSMGPTVHTITRLPRSHAPRLGPHQYNLNARSRPAIAASAIVMQATSP